MENALTANIGDRVARLDDPRVERANRDELLDLVTIAHVRGRLRRRDLGRR
jgi:hypothetical protein